MSKLDWNRPYYRITNADRREWDRELKKQSEPYDPADDVINFGKYKGFKFRTLPSSYIEWLISIAENESLALKYATILSGRSDYLKKLEKHK
jgi:hypothetical protein